MELYGNVVDGKQFGIFSTYLYPDASISGWYGGNEKSRARNKYRRYRSASAVK